MRIQPLTPETLSPDVRYVHDEIANLIGRSQGPVKMINENGALLGPFIAMLHFPQFGVEALRFLRSLDNHATISKPVREVAILTVAGFYGAKFILYAHEIMGRAFGIPEQVVATIAAGGHPCGLNEEEAIAHTIAYTLVNGKIVPESTYQYAVKVFGKDAVAELLFLISGYCLISVILNGFDIPAPEQNNY